MKNLAILFLSFSLSAFASEFDNSEYYYGSESSEAKLQFNYFVESTRSLNENEARLLIDKQLTYLFGAFNYNLYRAVPKVDHRIADIRIEPVSDGFRIHYNYTGTMVIEKKAPSVYEFPLVRNPSKIYSRSVVVVQGQTQYRCNSDLEHTEETYFWYFWNPNLANCPMVKGQDYDVIAAQVTRLPNTKKTFPEYKRLVENGVLRIDLLMGMNDESKSADPFKSSDLAAFNYRALHQQLLNMGYQARAWSPAEIRSVFPKFRGSEAFVESLTKESGSIKLEIRFFFGGTSIYAGGWSASAFHYFMKSAIEESSLFIYAGHSGLGDYLNLRKVEGVVGSPFDFNQDKYQIYFFNGCSSYPYYNSMYFDRKGGSKNLDILTNGLATYFSSINPSSLAVIAAMERYAMKGELTSYQEIINRADSSNLLGINGDEDNTNE